MTGSTPERADRPRQEKKLKSILFVINTMGMGGAENALLNLFQYMDLNTYRVSLYVLTGQGELFDQIPKEVTVLNKRFFPVSVYSGPGRIRLFKTVLKAMLNRLTLLKSTGYILKNLSAMLKEGRIQKEKLLWKILADGGQMPEQEYDLAVAYLEGGAAYYTASHVKAKKKAAFIHINYGEAGYSRMLDEDCYLHFDHIFTVSENVKEKFLQVYPECIQKTAVFYNLIDVEKIIYRSTETGGFTDNYEGIRILTVGRLVPQKALDTAIDTMRILKGTGKAFRWYVLGDGELRKSLEERIRSYELRGDFFLLGTVDNPYPFYKQCDLYVHTARYEGKSIAVEEAQVLGCAIIAAEYAGVEEQIENGVDGIVCKSDAEELAKEIQYLANDPRKRGLLGQAAEKKLQVDNLKEVSKIVELLGE